MSPKNISLLSMQSEIIFFFYAEKPKFQHSELLIRF